MCMMINSGSFLLVFVALLALNLMLVLTSTVTLTFEGDAAAVGGVHALNAIGAIVGGIVASARTSTLVRIAERDDVYCRETVLLSAPRSTLEA